MAESEFTAVAPLDGGHDRTPFDCGVPALNLYLRNYALQNQKKGIVRNYVTTCATRKVVVAYYSLVYAAIDQKRLPAKLRLISPASHPYLTLQARHSAHLARPHIIVSGGSGRSHQRPTATV